MVGWNPKYSWSYEQMFFLVTGYEGIYSSFSAISSYKPLD